MLASSGSKQPQKARPQSHTESALPYKHLHPYSVMACAQSGWGETGVYCLGSLACSLLSPPCPATHLLARAFALYPRIGISITTLTRLATGWRQVSKVTPSRVPPNQPTIPPFPFILLQFYHPCFEGCIHACACSHICLALPSMLLPMSTTTSAGASARAYTRTHTHA
jgi:hypothetical protein